MRATPLMPEARTRGLIVQTLPDEVLVYDRERHRAHCLNRSAALLWERCDGRTPVADVARGLGETLGQPTDVDAVWLGLRQLDERHLLAGRLGADAPDPGRREVLKRLGVGAAVVLPLVTSIVSRAAATHSLTLEQRFPKVTPTPTPKP